MSETILPFLRVADGPATAASYDRLGSTPLDEHRFGPDLPRHLFLRRGDVWVRLSEHAGDAPPGSLVHLHVDDVETLAAELGVAVGGQPWAREVELTDPDGDRLRVGQVRG